MDFLHADVEREYQRWLRTVEVDDPYEADDTVGLREVLRAHFLLIDYFVERNYVVGGVGPRDIDLLHSALSRQFTSYGGVKKWKGLFETCATLMFGLIMNHPFHDANKRTALLSVLFLLHRKKHIITLPQRRLDAMVVALAANELPAFLSKEARYQKRLQSLRRDESDEIIRVLADFLRRNTRFRDDSSRSMTFSELNRALRGHGFELRNPNGNYINVVRIEPARPANFLGLGGRREREVYLAQVGFPGWKDQVNRSALKTVREATGLTTKNGCDTQVLFREAEPLTSLISEYAEPLRRLANK